MKISENETKNPFSLDFNTKELDSYHIKTHTQFSFDLHFLYKETDKVEFDDYDIN